MLYFDQIGGLASISDEELLHRYEEYEYALDNFPKEQYGSVAHERAFDKFDEYFFELNMRTLPSFLFIDPEDDFDPWIDPDDPDDDELFNFYPEELKDPVFSQEEFEDIEF